MTRMIGKGKYAGEVYPERQPAAPPPTPPVRAAFAFDQNNNSWLHTQGNVNLIIATATITLQAGSRVRIDGNTTFLGGVATGRFLFFAGDATGSVLVTLVSQSFTVGEFEVSTYLGVLDTPQAAGPLTLTLVVNQNSNAGATVASAGENVLMLTEILP